MTSVFKFNLGKKNSKLFSLSLSVKMYNFTINDRGQMSTRFSIRFAYLHLMRNTSRREGERDNERGEQMGDLAAGPWTREINFQGARRGQQLKNLAQRVVNALSTSA